MGDTSLLPQVVLIFSMKPMTSSISLNVEKTTLKYEKNNQTIKNDVNDQSQKDGIFVYITNISIIKLGSE